MANDFQLIQTAMKRKKRLTLAYPQHGMAYYEGGKPKPYGGPQIFRGIVPFTVGPSKVTGRTLLRAYDFARNDWRLFYLDKAKITLQENSFNPNDPTFALFRKEKIDSAMSSVKYSILDFQEETAGERKKTKQKIDISKLTKGRGALLRRLIKR